MSLLLIFVSGFSQEAFKLGTTNNYCKSHYGPSKSTFRGLACRGGDGPKNSRTFSRVRGFGS